MSRRPASLLIEDMLERIRRIERSVAGMDHTEFLLDDTTIDAVIRNLTVIGEAANRLPQEFKDRHLGVPWHRIVGCDIVSFTTTSMSTSISFGRS